MNDLRLTLHFPHGEVGSHADPQGFLQQVGEDLQALDNDPKVSVTEERTPAPPDAAGISELVEWVVQHRGEVALFITTIRLIVTAVSAAARRYLKPSQDLGARVVIKFDPCELELPASQSAADEFVACIEKAHAKE